MPFPTSMFAQNGRFTEIHPIGQGAAGQVYVARDNLGRQVAVKEALPTTEAFGSMRTKFEKESRIQANLQHPNIIAVYHLEEDPHTQELYLICEYANTGSLADYLDQHGVLPEAEALAIALDICAALEETHRQKIVHRDIKPSNILLQQDECGQLTAKLGDFGIAQDQKLRRTTIFPGTTHPGTPLYMPPEQTDVTAILDTRADIYALGITLWEMLTGKDYKGLLHDTPLPLLQSYNAAVGGGTATIIQKAVQPEPPQRYQRPQEMYADIQRVLEGKAPAATVSAPHMGDRPPSRSQHRPSRELRFGLAFGLMFGLAALIVLSLVATSFSSLVLAIVAGWFIWLGQRSHTQTAPAARLGALLLGWAIVALLLVRIANWAVVTLGMPWSFGWFDSRPAVPDAAAIPMNTFAEPVEITATAPPVPTTLPPTTVPTSVGGNDEISIGPGNIDLSDLPTNSADSVDVRGSGSVREEVRNVADFQAIALAGMGTLIIKQDDVTSLTVEAEDNLLPYLTSDVRDGQLILATRDDTNLDPTQPIVYRVSLPTLEQLDITGVGSADVQDIDTDKLGISITGPATVTATGNVDQQTVTITGMGSYNGEQLASRVATVNLTGGDNAVIQVSDVLDATVNGVGSVEYIGDPTVTQQIIGVGSIIKR